MILHLIFSFKLFINVLLKRSVPWSMLLVTYFQLEKLPFADTVCNPFWDILQANRLFFLLRPWLRGLTSKFLYEILSFAKVSLIHTVSNFTVFSSWKNRTLSWCIWKTRIQSTEHVLISQDSWYSVYNIFFFWQTIAKNKNKLFKRISNTQTLQC